MTVSREEMLALADHLDGHPSSWDTDKIRKAAAALRSQGDRGALRQDGAGREFLDAILSACDASNWDADGNKGDYFRGLSDAYEAIQLVAMDHQQAIYAADVPAQCVPLASAIKVIKAEPCPFKDGPVADAWAEAWATFLNRLGDVDGTNDLYAASSRTPHGHEDVRQTDWFEECSKQAGKAFRFHEALQSIANSTCCGGCQEAALVARAALSREEREHG